MNCIREEIISLADSKYAVFAAKLLPAGTNIIGVRLPILRKLARKLSSTKDGIFFVQNSREKEVFEEKMLRGIIIGELDMPIMEKIKLINKFIPQIDNWSVCDSFCTSLKIKEENKRDFLNFLKSCMSSDSEFRYRFGVVMIKNLYLENCYIDEVIELIARGCPDAYYAQMGVAWTICETYIRFPEKTRELLEGNNLSDKVKMLARRKIRESLRT